MVLLQKKLCFFQGIRGGPTFSGGGGGPNANFYRI